MEGWKESIFQSSVLSSFLSRFMFHVSRFTFSLLLLLVLASAALADTKQVPISFVDVAADSGIDFEHTDGKSGVRLFNEFLGSGGGFFDYDNDGDLDIYLVNGAPQVASPFPSRPRGGQGEGIPTNALYRNNGDGTFMDVTSEAGVGDTGYGAGCAVGDYDNDGYVDLYVTNFGPNVLYRNNGDGTFTDVSVKAGVANGQWGTSCAFADVDNDGFLDLYIANYADYAIEKDKRCYVRGIWTYCGPRAYPPARDVFYHNNGDGTFSDWSEKCGFWSVPPAHGLGVAFGDYNDDGAPDLYVANDQDANYLFQNRGDGTFEEVGLLSGVSYSDAGKPEAGMGTAFGDYDNDGRLDLTVSNFQKETNTLYHNEGDGFFSDVTITTGIAEVTYSYLGWGIAFFDYDNDGNKDIFVANGHVLDNIEEIDSSTTFPQRNLLFRNLGNGTFAHVTDLAGPGLTLRKVSRAAAFGDYDNDGDIDILVTNWNQTADLLRNEGTPPRPRGGPEVNPLGPPRAGGGQNRWIQIRAVGTKSNRSGIGARIKIVAGGLTQYAEVQSGGSYLSFSDLRVHFGLGGAERVELVELRWPSGLIDTAKGLAVNAQFVATEGKGLEICHQANQQSSK